MKVVIVLCLSVALVIGAQIKPKTVERLIIADVLRDFPGVCYASTQCRTFKDGEEWDLKPFCGLAGCVKTAEGRLMESVKDCGLPAKENPKCKVTVNATLSFPDCCPIYDCEDGVELDFPSLPPPPPKP